MIGPAATLTEIYVDADACPVKDEVMRVAERHGLTVHMVANSLMRYSTHPGVNFVVVAEGADAADDWIAGHIGAQGIAITADIPLAARCLAAGGRALGPTGKSFTDDSIGMALAMRGLKSDLRETGEISCANPSFTKKDRSRFLETLENTVQAVRRGA